MADYFVGADALITSSVTDADLDLEDGTVTVAVTKPDGTLATVSAPTHVSTGKYTAIVSALPMAGIYMARWVAVVGSFTGVDVYSFSVGAAGAYPPFAAPSDVATRWRTLTTAEQATAESNIRDASAYLRAWYPGIDSQLISGAVDPDIMIAVTANMVKRAMMGAQTSGASQASQTAGPYSTSVTYANPTGNLYVLAAEDQMIRGYQPAGVSKYFGNTTVRRTPAVSDFESWYDGGITIVGS